MIFQEEGLYPDDKMQLGVTFSTNAILNRTPFFMTDLVMHIELNKKRMFRAYSHLF